MLVGDKDFKAPVVTVLGEVKEKYFCAQRKGSHLSTPSRKYRKELPMALCPPKSGLKSSPTNTCECHLLWKQDIADEISEDGVTLG